MGKNIKKIHSGKEEKKRRTTPKLLPPSLVYINNFCVSGSIDKICGKNKQAFRTDLPGQGSKSYRIAGRVSLLCMDGKPCNREHISTEIVNAAKQTLLGSQRCKVNKGLEMVFTRKKAPHGMTLVLIRTLCAFLL